MRRKRFALAAVLAAVVALLAVGSGAAIACPGTTSTINGIGSSLQRVAQERLWIPGYNAACPELHVTYEPLGSGEGFRAWRAEAGVKETARRSGFHFIATDDAPSRAQVENLRISGEEAAGPVGGQGVEIVPVAQAAISVIAKPPTGCTITRIKNEELEQIFRHVITDWERVTTATETLGGPCAAAAITRVVRLDRSGTTYQFKHYLWLIHSLPVIVTGRVETERTWLELQEPTENLVWPEEGVGLIRPAGRGGGELVREVERTAGSIGYASITDSFPAPAGVTILRVLNGRSPGEPFAEPTRGAENASNCAAVRYKNRLGEAAGVVIRETEIVENLEKWGEIYGSNPRIGERAETRETYPICTLTWDVAYREYRGAGYIPNTIGRHVREYFLYIVEPGQARLGERHYAELPAAIRRGARELSERIG